MSESIWWPDEAWFERKVLPLGFITLSFRQLITMMVAFLVGFLVSLPFEFPIAGISFGGRAAVFCVVFGIGYMVSSRRVRLIPVELQAVYFLRTKGVEKLRANLRRLLGSKRPEKDPVSESRQPTIVQEMVVDDFKNPVPLVVADRLNHVQKESRVLLLLDDQVRGEDSVSLQKPRYRLLYVPAPEDIGTHRLTVRLEGSPEPLVSVSLSLKGRGPEIGESVIRTG
jgi:hypothetical protein